MTAIAIVNGSNEPKVNLHDQMTEQASTLAAYIKGRETEIGKRAKDWGHVFLKLVILEGQSAPSLIGDAKTAMGWNKLVGEAGTAVKKRFNVWFSNLNLVLENWSSLDKEVTAQLLDGERSFTTVAKAIQDGAKAEKKEAEKAAKGEGEAVQPAAPEPASPVLPVNSFIAMAEFLKGMDDAALMDNAVELATLYNAANAAMHRLAELAKNVTPATKAA